jgi:hypothetical protein
MTTQRTIHSFLLIDGAVLAPSVPVPVDSSIRPGWLIPVYDETVASIGPLVIDIQAACDSGELATPMALLNAAYPQLHVSIIDTALPHAGLVQHLRRFIMIRTHDGRALTLRFADCLGLPVLAATLSAEQWAALAGPVKRWCVHRRDGALCDLPLPDPQQIAASTPLVLGARQLEDLAEATGPDEMIANIREMRHDRPMAGSASEQHQWAFDARHMWRSAGNTDLIVLRWLTASALDTSGAVLRQTRLPSVLALQDKAAIRAGLDDAMGRLIKTPVHEVD